ncbi:MAG TPA: LytTR family DNA-binding domain-containing protein [Thermoanaerobaculia bacterium]|nr:LytTR family DNA-binding domain-containing protein [Thermoanaerobaculia bacterium]
MGELDPTNGPPNDRWRLSGRELFLIFLFWTSLAAVTAANRYLDPRGFGLRVISPVGPVVFPFIEAWLWAAFTPLIFWLSSRYRIEGSNWIVRIPLLLVIGVAIAIAVDVMLEIARFELFPTPRRRGATAFAPFRGIGRFRFLHQLVLRMQTLEERLDPARFFRIHRSAIVRLDLIDSMLRSPGGDYAVRLEDGTELSVSRARREELEQKLGAS